MTGNKRIFSNFFKKLKYFSQKAGIRIGYASLLMYYAYSRRETPLWAKNIILGSIAYFISPIDAVPDLTPFLGYTDDWGILSFGLVTIAAYIDDEVRGKARLRLMEFFPKINLKEIEAVEEQL